jgi:5-methylcytosine-specific restriction endonuclease McrA
MAFLFTEERRDETHPLLGYTANQLRDHLLLHPGSSGLSRDDATIDHIFPQHAFREYGISDGKVIHSLANLQPMSRRANSCKGASYDANAFERWLAAQGVPFDRPRPIPRRPRNKLRPRFKSPEPD